MCVCLFVPTVELTALAVRRGRKETAELGQQETEEKRPKTKVESQTNTQKRMGIGMISIGWYPYLVRWCPAPSFLLLFGRVLVWSRRQSAAALSPAMRNPTEPHSHTQAGIHTHTRAQRTYTFLK